MSFSAAFTRSLLAPRRPTPQTAHTLSSPTHLPARAVSSSPYGRAHIPRRRARKLPNPIVPQFPQRVLRADGSSFTHWTTSPRSIIRLTRDVTNNPLWNIGALTREGGQEESAVSGRLGRFTRRFEEGQIDWMGEAESMKGGEGAEAQAKLRGKGEGKGGRK